MKAVVLFVIAALACLSQSVSVKQKAMEKVLPQAIPQEIQLPGGIAPSKTPKSRMLDLINAYRKKNGKGPVKEDERLSAAAQERAPYYSHNAQGQTPGQAAKKHGWEGNSIGEIIASGQKDVNEAVKSWMGSPGHAAIMRGNFEYIGLGISGTKYCCIFGSK